MGSRITQEELTSQQEKMAEIFALNQAYYEEYGRGRTACVDTYGCQQNEADSEAIRGMLLEMGYELVSETKGADLIIINTCAVREHAEQRALGNIGHLVHGKAEKRDQVIAVCGCMAQQESIVKKLKESFQHVDMVFGTHALWRFPELLCRRMKLGKRIFDISESEGAIAEGLPLQRDGKIKAWVSIMYGCNNFCSYCIVPYVRGRERSRDSEAVLSEVRALVSEGYKDITLLGQNVNSFGRDLGEGINFAALLEKCNAIEGDFLIRFMTSHPKDATPKLFDAMAASPKVAKHIHLPFQAGNDRVLKAMNRGYTAESYIELIDYARSVMPEIVLTSDVIVGFPGETDEEFEDTLKLIERVRFDALFTFIFSKRGGTPAAKLDDPFTREQKQVRFDKLIELQNRISLEKHEAYIGKQMRLLIDGHGTGATLTARTNGGRLVHLKIGGEELAGGFVTAEITGSNNWSLNGKIIDFPFGESI